MRGSVLKRGKSWTYVLDLGRDASGKRQQKWVGGFRTRKEAEVALAEALGRSHAGVSVAQPKLTLTAFAADWIEAVGPSLAASTLVDYRRFVETVILPRLGHMKLSAITPVHLTRFNNELLVSGGRGGRPLAPRTVVYVHTVLGKMLQDATVWGLIPRNPARAVKRPKAARGEMAVWTPDEARAFLASVRDDRLFALWFLLLTTGMRRGEVAGLKWTDLDLDSGTLSVQRARVAVDYDVVESEPKTARSRRRIALDPATVDALRTHRRQQLEERLAAGELWNDTGYVFVYEDGTPYHPQGLTDRFQKLVATAGVPRIRFHDLRHTAATMMLVAGVHPKVVQERLGHSSIGITLDTYSHVIEGMQGDAAGRMAAALLSEAQP